MRTLILVGALLAFAAPSFACEWQSAKSASSPQTPPTVVQTEAPQTPPPAQPQG